MARRFHYVLKDTTVASGEWEGLQRDENGAWKPKYHGCFPQGTPQGASFLYWVDSKPDSGAFGNPLRRSPMFIFLCSGNALSRVLEAIAQKHLIQ